MIKGYIFDYGGTLDTGGCHWGKVFWHLYQRLHVPVSEARFREAYVYAERTLGRNPIIQPYFTFRQTLEAKVRLQMEYLGMVGYESSVVEAAYEQTQAHTSHSRDVLLTLKQDYPLVLVSNFYGNIHTVLQEFGLDTLFCDVIESAVVGIRKPDPRIPNLLLVYPLIHGITFDKIFFQHTVSPDAELCASLALYTVAHRDNNIECVVWYRFLYTINV